MKTCSNCRHLNSSLGLVEHPKCLAWGKLITQQMADVVRCDHHEEKREQISISGVCAWTTIKTSGGEFIRPTFDDDLAFNIYKVLGERTKITLEEIYE